MAWTAPRTWVTGELVTATLLNAHLRDNLLETAPAKVTTQGDTVYATAANALARLAKGTAFQTLRMNAGATAPEWASSPILRRKTADESVANNTLQDDDDLRFPIGASDVWQLTAYLRFSSSSATPDVKFTFTGPTSISGRILFFAIEHGGAVVNANSQTVSDTPSGQVFALSASVATNFIVSGIVIGGGTAGDVKLVWAQNATDAGNPTTLAAHSHLIAHRVA